MKIPIDTWASIDVMKALAPDQTHGLTFTPVNESDAQAFLKEGAVGSFSGISMVKP